MLDTLPHEPVTVVRSSEQRLQERIIELERQLAAATVTAAPPCRPEDDIRPILDAIPIPIYVKDAQGSYQGCNTAYETYLGISRSQIIGRTGIEVDPDDL